LSKDFLPMHTPFRPLSMTTPIEPGRVRRPLLADTDPREARHGSALGRFEAAAASACGRLHDSNEDAHSSPGGPGRLFVVADGVGGGAMAQLASRELVELLHAALAHGRIDADRVRAAVLDADRAIARRIARQTNRPGAATLALCARLDPFASRWLVAWVGDCRVYRHAGHDGAALELLTRDDTFGALAETPPAGGSLDDPARMVGNGAVAHPGAANHALARGAFLVLCSDGVHKHLGADEWTRVLARPAVPLARRCDELIARARANGSSDDATVLMLRRPTAGEQADAGSAP
jgi:serine/threonine protein phosphatase PrpC